jgi:hypothetical protein
LPNLLRFLRQAISKHEYAPYFFVQKSVCHEALLVVQENLPEEDCLVILGDLTSSVYFQESILFCDLNMF